MSPRAMLPTTYGLIRPKLLDTNMYYYTYDRLNMFRALLCPSSGAHDYSADCNMGRPVFGVTVGWKLGAGRLDKYPDCRLCPGCRL